MSTLVFSRAGTDADVVSDAMWTFTFATADNKFSVNLGLTVSITPVAPAEGPPVLSGWPAAVSLASNFAQGDVLAQGSVTNSDGTPFTGTVTGVDAAGNPLPVTFQA